MAKVAIYARVSTQLTQDYQYQINSLTTLILSKGYKKEDIEVFAEAISGYKKNHERPQLEALINITESNPKYFDCIYTAEISRIGRKPSDTRKIIDRWTDLGQQVHIPKIGNILDENGKQSMLTSIILQILIEYANLEAETFKTRSRSGLLDSAKKGRAGGGRNIAYGYFRDEFKQMVIEETESEIVKEIFKLYAEGNGIKVISNILNDKKTPTRYNKAYAGTTIKFNIEKNADAVRWSDKQIHDILKNTLYKGQRRYKGELISAPSIIPIDLFDKCTAIMHGKTHRNYLTTYTYLLKDLVVCGRCGRNYFAKYKPVKGGDKVYICSSRLNKEGGCGNLGINITLIESALYDLLINSTTLIKYLNDTKSIKQELTQDIKRLTERLRIDEKKINDIESKRKRLLNVHINGKMSYSEFVEQQKEIDNDISLMTEKLTILKNELNQKKEALVRQDDNKATKSMLVKAKDNRSELKTIYGQFISKVIINKVDTNYLLATVFISLNGVNLINTLKVLLDIQSIRKKPIVYRYTSTSKMVNDPVFKNNILLVEVEDIKQEMINKLKYNDWTNIPKKHLLEI